MSIASAVDEQGAATAEIARNVQQTAQAAQDVTANIGGVSRAATERRRGRRIRYLGRQVAFLGKRNNSPSK